MILRLGGEYGGHGENLLLAWPYGKDDVVDAFDDRLLGRAVDRLVFLNPSADWNFLLWKEAQ